MRSTPTPNDCLRTVNVSRAPEPWRLMHDTLEHLDALTRALDHLEVDADGVTGLEDRDLAQLRLLDALDDCAHGKRRPSAGCGV